MLIQPAPVPSIAEAQRNALAIRGGQMQNALARQKLQDYPEEQAWTREKRGMEREDYEYTKHLREFQTSMEPLVKLEALDKMMRLVANKTTLANHDMVTANLAKQLGVDPSQAQQEPTAAQIAQQAQAAGQDPETYYQTVYKPQALMTWEQKFELMKEQVKAGKSTRKVGETRHVQKGGQLVTEEWNGTDWKEIGRGPKFKPTEPKTRIIGETRKFQRGSEEITQEWTGTEWKELGKGPKFKDDKGKETQLKDLASRFSQTIGRANSATMGVGQFIPDPNRQSVAQKEYERAKILAIQYIKAGGKLSDLGIPDIAEETYLLYQNKYDLSRNEVLKRYLNKLNLSAIGSQ